MKFATLAAAGLIATSLSLTVHAQTLEKDRSSRITFHNKTDHALWLTMYTSKNIMGPQNNVARNCVAAGENLTLDGTQKIVEQRYYHIRVEEKADPKSCKNGSNVTNILYQDQHLTNVYLRKPAGLNRVAIASN